MVVLDLLVTMLVRFYIPYSTNFLFLLVLGECVQFVHVAHPGNLEQTVLVRLLHAQFSAYLHTGQGAAWPGGTGARSPASTCTPALALAGMTTSGPGGTLQFESAMGGAARCCSPSCLSASDPGDLLLAVASVRLAMSCIVVLIDNIDPCTYLHCNSRYPCNPCNSDG